MHDAYTVNVKNSDIAIKFYETVTVLALVYRSEVWVMMPQQRERIKAAEMKLM
jgi:hypothetical protein